MAIHTTADYLVIDRILAALRAELPTLTCYEPSRLIGQPCSCVVGMARAIEIVEGMQ